MRSSHRKTKFGYKAVIIHATGRTELLARTFALSEDKRDMVQTRAAKQFNTAKEAREYAERTIKLRHERSMAAEAKWLATHPAQKD